MVLWDQNIETTGFLWGLRLILSRLERNERAEPTLPTFMNHPLISELISEACISKERSFQVVATL